MKQLIYGFDEKVAEWTQNVFGVPPGKYEMAVAIVEHDKIVGSIMWHAFRGHDIEISYYGPKTMTLGIARACARVAVDHFGVSRVSARTAKRNKTMTKGIEGIGFRYEGIIHAGYGNKDAVLYGLYGKNLARLAGKEMH